MKAEHVHNSLVSGGLQSEMNISASVWANFTLQFRIKCTGMENHKLSKLWLVCVKIVAMNEDKSVSNTSPKAFLSAEASRCSKIVSSSYPVTLLPKLLRINVLGSWENNKILVSLWTTRQKGRNSICNYHMCCPIYNKKTHSAPHTLHHGMRIALHSNILGLYLEYQYVTLISQLKPIETEVEAMTAWFLKTISLKLSPNSLMVQSFQVFLKLFNLHTNNMKNAHCADRNNSMHAQKLISRFTVR